MINSYFNEYTDILRFNFPLKNSNWLRVGGNAEALAKIQNPSSLVDLLQHNANKYPVTPLGVGSNVIIRDNGIEGLVVKLGKYFNKFDIDNNTITFGANVLDQNAATIACQNGLSGLEFLATIPGTIGGGIAMNAGCYGSDISEFFVHCDAINVQNGKKYRLFKKDMGFKYRDNSLDQQFIFISATFKLHNKSSSQIEKLTHDLITKRAETQPVRVKTGGSTFKNPADYKAWEIIDKCGLRGYKINDAQISEKHCNFMINNGNATATDLESLGEHVIKTVYSHTGIRLEWEIKRIGLK